MNTAHRIYFAVPTHYGYGPEFDTYDDARDEALGKIREIEGCPGSFTRAFVDVRIHEPSELGNGTTDRVLHRVEIFAPQADPALASQHADEVPPEHSRVA